MPVDPKQPIWANLTNATPAPHWESLTGWRLYELNMAFRQYDRNQKGYLNSTECRRLLLSFGVKWTKCQEHIPKGKSWNPETVIQKVEELAPTKGEHGLCDKSYDLFVHYDRAQGGVDGKTTGKISADTFYDAMIQHGITHDELNLLLYKYSNGTYKVQEVVYKENPDATGKKKMIVDGTKMHPLVEKHWCNKKEAKQFKDGQQVGHKKYHIEENRGDKESDMKYEFPEIPDDPGAHKRRMLEAPIGYADLHRDLFPTDGWETSKYWQKENKFLDELLHGRENLGDFNWGKLAKAL